VRIPDENARDAHQNARERLIDRWRSARAEFERVDDALRALSRSCAARGGKFHLASAYAIAQRIRRLRERRAQARARLLSAVVALAAQRPASNDRR
jgi:hypothetical protein